LLSPDLLVGSVLGRGNATFHHSKRTRELVEHGLHATVPNAL
jgi:hypothetical protein